MGKFFKMIITMESYLDPGHYDLITPDGIVTQIQRDGENKAFVNLFIENISPAFIGFQIPLENVFFNIKSTLAQVGVEGFGLEYQLDQKNHCAEIKIELISIDEIGRIMLSNIEKGAYIGKLFAADDRRRVRNPDYLSRMFGRADRFGNPLLSLGGLHGSTDLILDVVDGRTVAYLSLQNGRLIYKDSIKGLLPTIGKALISGLPTRELVGLHQEWESYHPRNANEGELLLVRTLPLHIRTVFGRVVNELLSKGYKHTSASVLQPDTFHSGDVYELYGNSVRELTDIPLEFYTLEPHREFVFFSDRDQLQTCIEDSSTLFKAFETAPTPKVLPASVFVVKGEQLLNLKESDWIIRETWKHEFPGHAQKTRQALMVERYVKQQPSYPFLRAIENSLITSQGVLLTRYFPSPLMKRILLSDMTQTCLKGIYFQSPSKSGDDFFSYEDRALLIDLEKYAIPVYWLDQHTQNILQYVQKPDSDSGMFVPLDKVDTFLNATLFGIYGSNLMEGEFEEDLRSILMGVLELKEKMDHPLLNPNTSIALVTGGGPGAMEVGNRVAKELGILSCANIVDFRAKDGGIFVNEQLQNPYVEAKMTYRLDKLVERQAEFNLDFPIFLIGGIGTDFEFSLEEVRRKVGAVAPNPMLLMGDREYWKSKITDRFQCNVRSETNKGSEWLSNCYFNIHTAQQGIDVYRSFFEGTLKIGPEGPIYDEGFVTNHTRVEH